MSESEPETHKKIISVNLEAIVNLGVATALITGATIDGLYNGIIGRDYAHLVFDTAALVFAVAIGEGQRLTIEFNRPLHESLGKTNNR